MTRAQDRPTLEVRWVVRRAIGDRDPRLWSVEVVGKRVGKYTDDYVIKSHEGMGFQTNVPRTSLHATPLEAWQAHLAMAVKDVERRCRALAAAEAEVERAKREIANLEANS